MLLGMNVEVSVHVVYTVLRAFAMFIVEIGAQVTPAYMCQKTHNVEISPEAVASERLLHVPRSVLRINRAVQFHWSIDQSESRIRPGLAVNHPRRDAMGPRLGTATPL